MVGWLSAELTKVKTEMKRVQKRSPPRMWSKSLNLNHTDATPDTCLQCRSPVLLQVHNDKFTFIIY